MSEKERKAQYERVKERRRQRWAEMEARRPPAEFAAYGFASMLGFVVFVIWSIVAPSVFANVAIACCIIVWAAWVVSSWRWEDQR